MLDLVVDGQPVPVLGVAALGVVVGYVAGMFGLGGGFLMTPLMVVLFRIPLPIAVGTGLCQMVGTSMVSALKHRTLGQGEVRFDLAMLPGSLLGVELGTRALTQLAGAGSVSFAGRSIPWVSLVVEGGYATMLGAVAISYWRHGSGKVDILQYLRPGPMARARLGASADLPAVHLRGVSLVLIGYVGVFLGFLSGLLGIGGGVALNPILLYAYGFPIRQAVGTGIVVLFVTAVFGTFSHALRGHVHLGMALTLLVGGTVSAQLGALASKKMSGGALAKIHAVVIVAAASAVLWDLARHLR